MNADDNGALLDLVYAAAFDPSLWDDVLARLADHMGGTSAWLSRLNLSTGDGEGVTARIDPVMPTMYKQHYAALNPFIHALAAQPIQALRRPSVLTDREIVDRDDLIRTPYFNEFMAPQDVSEVAVIRLLKTTNESIAININRPARRGLFLQEDIEVAVKVQTHLLRAFQISDRLAPLQIMRDSLVNALDELADGVFIVDGDARIRHANRAAEGMLHRQIGLVSAQGRLGALHTDAARRLENAVAKACSSQAGDRKGASVSIRADNRRLPLSAVVVPLGADTFPVFARDRSALVCVQDLERDLNIADDRLTELFGLTPKERQITALLFKGQDPRQIAADLSITYNTVRVHLARISTKTNTARQSELVKLIARLAALRTD